MRPAQRCHQVAPLVSCVLLSCVAVIGGGQSSSSNGLRVFTQYVHTSCCSTLPPTSPISAWKGRSPPLVNFVTKVTVPEHTSEFTLCMFINLIYKYTEPAIILVFGDIICLYVFRDEIWVKSGNTSTFKTGAYVPLRRWQHLCLHLGSDPGVTLNRVKYEAYPFIGDMADQRRPVPSGLSTLLLGMPSGWAVGGMNSPAGMHFTLPTVYHRRLQSTEIDQLSLCRGPEAEGHLLQGPWALQQESDKTMRDLGTSSGPASGLKLGYANEEVGVDPCSRLSTIRYIVQERRVTPEDAEPICRSIGATLPSNTLGKEDIELIRKEGNFSSDASFWLHTSTPSECTILRLLLEGTFDIISKSNCTNLLATTITCKVLMNSVLEHRESDLSGTENRERFFLELSNVSLELYSSKRYWIGVCDPDTWCYKDNKNVALYATKSFPVTDWPVGRRQWTKNPSARGNSYDTLLTITSCSKEEFTCDDGECLSVSLRCDRSLDCRDQSDERNCVFILPLDASYDPQRAPLREMALNVTLQHFQVSNVDMGKGFVSTHIRLHTTWEDHRVRFQQLSDSHRQNELAGNKLWNPTYELEGVVFSDYVSFSRQENVISELYAEKTGSGPYIVHDSYEGQESYANLILVDEFAAAYKCPFSLRLFPFGLYVCDFNFSIMYKGPMTPVFSAEGVSAILEQAKVSLFSLTKMQYRLYPEEKPRTFSLRVMFASDFGAYILTTILPCIVIGAIGDLTLLFHTHNFTDRIMVTLSCLIVIASIFSQMTSTMPASAAPKAIDIYFFYYILHLFLVCMHHSALYYLIRRHQNATTHSRKGEQSKQKTESKFYGLIRFTKKTTRLPTWQSGPSSEEINVSSDVDYLPATSSKSPKWTPNPDTKKESLERKTPFYAIYNKVFVSLLKLFDCLGGLLFIGWILWKRDQVYGAFNRV